MGPTSKKALGAQRLPEDRRQQAAPARRFKPGVTQLKSVVSAQSVKRPIAPPAYSPQPTPNAAQPKMANGASNRKVPVAPPVYCPQPVPKVLQTKTWLTKSPHAGQAMRQPVAPPVYRPETKKTVQPKAHPQLRKAPTAPPVSRPEGKGNIDKPQVGSSHPRHAVLEATISRALSIRQRKEVESGTQPALASRQGTLSHARALVSHSLAKAKNVVIQRAAVLGGGAVHCGSCGVASPRSSAMCWSCMEPLETDHDEVLETGASSYKPTRLPKTEMSDSEYEAYAKSSEEWMAKRAAKEVAKLKVGSYLYHGTSEEVARIVATDGLQPASPIFRKVPKGMKRWDASRDGFLSMATQRGGVTVTAKSVVLRMTVEQGDLEIWQWKSVGGAGEVVTTRPIPSARLEWSKDKVNWHPMSDL